MTWTSPQSVALPLEYLREIGVVPLPAATVASGPLEELLADYRRYLLVERRLAEHTVVMRISRPRGCSWLAGRAWSGSGWSGCRRRT